MDVVVRSRGAKISVRSKEHVTRRLSRLSRLNGRLQRIDVEITQGATPRVDGGHRVEATARAGRQTFRASGTGSDVDIAVERVAEKLERQITDEHGRRRARMIGGANRIKLGSLSPPDSEEPDSQE